MVTRAVLALALLSLGCQPEGAPIEELAGSEEVPDAAIINGALVDGNAGGVVVAAIDTQLDGYTECSAVMLNRNWLLTAKHCVDAPNSSWVRVFARAQPSPLTVFERWPRTENSSTIYKHPTEDVALVYFRDTTATYTLDYSNPIHQGTDASLIGKTVSCYGFGNDGFTSAGELRLRSGEMVVSKTGYAPCLLGDCTYKAHGFFVPTNAAGQVQWHGDSGGPCFVNVGGARYIAGIAHQSELKADGSGLVGAWEAGAESFRDWVYSTTGTVAGASCVMGSATVSPATTSAVVRWTTSAWALGIAEVTTNGSQWTSAECRLVGFKVPCMALTSPSRTATFKGLQPGTAYTYRAGASCNPLVKEGVKVLAPIRVYQYGTFKTLN